MVDPDAVGVPEGAGQRGREEAIAVFPDALRVQGLEPPVLAVGEEAVGWSTTVDAGDEGSRGPFGVEAPRM